MRILWTVMVLALAGASAQPLSTGGSNMGTDFYPKPGCEPAGPAPSSPGSDADGRTIYNAKVRSFNQKIAAFNLCMKLYVDNAQNDINTIQKIVHDSVVEPTQTDRGGFVTDMPTDMLAPARAGLC